MIPGKTINQEFEVSVGVTSVLAVKCVDIYGNEYNLSTVQDITWKLAQQLNLSPLITKTKTGGSITITNVYKGVTLSTNCVALIKIDPADTSALSGKYYHDANIVDSAGVKRDFFWGTASIVKRLSS